MSVNITGVSVTSTSCSGTCLILRRPRHAKVSATEAAPGRGGRSTEESARIVASDVVGSVARATRAVSVASLTRPLLPLSSRPAYP